MKIAQIVPNWTQFHADKAIGIKAVVRDLTKGLLAKGHEVTLFAPDKSTFPDTHIKFSGPSLADCGSSLMDSRSPLLQHEYARKIVQELRDFDVVHSHIEHNLLPFLNDILMPVVSTIHGANFQENEVNQFKKYSKGTFVALSEGAKLALPYIHFSFVVYNGVQVETCPFFQTIQSPGYLAWMGRFAKNKGALDAIAVAKKLNEVLVLMGIEQKNEPEYYEQVQQEADGAMIRIIHRMLGLQKYDFLGNAKALLFPIHWEEPFGLVMVEAMACGTPVIAYNRGSVPEIVKDGVTGFIIEPEAQGNRGNQGNRVDRVIQKTGIPGLVEAMGRIGQIDRAACRKHVEENFSVEKMVAGYEGIYGRLGKSGK